MACTLFSRMFYRTRISRHSHDARVQRENITARELEAEPPPVTHSRFSVKKLNSAMLSTMNPQPFASVLIRAVPGWIHQSYFEELINLVHEVMQVRVRTFSTRFDLILDFRPDTDAFKALGISPEDPHININNQCLKVDHLLGLENLERFRIVSKIKRPPSTLSTTPETPHRGSLLLDNFSEGLKACSVCFEELSGPFSTPCWTCLNAECHACMRTHFQETLKDFQLFPARCCDLAFHPDVAKGILPHDVLVKYKTRFQEWLAVDPCYCPVPTCSAFIPPRSMEKSKDGMFTCHTCQVSICALCKRVAHPGRKCPASSMQKETMDIMKKFGYKQCPRCGTAVGKMYGCSHMQCKCGAHWCWECRRKIEICNLNPCDVIDEEYEYGAYGARIDYGSDIESSAEPTADDVPGVIGQHDVEVAIQDTVPVTDTALTEFVEADSDQGASKVDNADESIIPRFSVHRQQTRAVYNAILNLGLDLRRRICDPHSDQPNVRDNQFSTPQNSLDQLAASSAIIEYFRAHTLDETTSHEPKDTDPDATADSTALIDTFEINANPQESPAAARATATATATANPEPDNINLDDPAGAAWEHDGLFFGREPMDDDPLDIWGCLHHFETITYDKVPRHWMSASLPDWWFSAYSRREIECMLCWKPARCALKPEDVEAIKDEEAKQRYLKDWRLARRCTKCNVIVCRKCRNELVKADTSKE